uniref:Theromacin n=1 Tax=Panagrolaimus sp. ES5 TaxID=591445 RepID=A0AC34GR55_9BILA
MKFLICLFIVALIAITFIPNQSTANPIDDCWKQWSRCTKWSSGGTGILWDDCDTHCKCKGYADGGKCVDVTSQCKLSETAYQCQCHGSKGKPTGSDCV